MAFAPLVTSKILWSKPDSQAFLCILSADSAGMFFTSMRVRTNPFFFKQQNPSRQTASLLKERPAGSAILRLDEGLANTQKKSP